VSCVGASEFRRRPATSGWRVMRWKGRGLCDRSRRPRHSPTRTVDEVAERVIQLRRESRNSWGGRKLARLLAEEGGLATGTQYDHRHPAPRRPARSGRRTRPARVAALRARRTQRPVADGCQGLLSFARPRQLSSADRALRSFAVRRAASGLRRPNAVQPCSKRSPCVCRRYGLPAAMLMDNGSRWGDRDLPFTALSLWLIRLGIRVSHSRPYHPQTQARTSAFIARLSSRSCATSISLRSSTASASSIVSATAAICAARTTR